MAQHRTPSQIVRTAVGMIIVAAAASLTGCTTPPVSLSGTVTSTTGMATTNIEVAVYAADSPTQVATTRTTNGTFSFTADQVPFGSYRVRFADGSWWPDATNWNDAQTITTTPTSPATLDPTLSITGATFKGYSVASGRVLPEGGAGVYSATTGAYVASGWSYYDIPFEIVVPPGSYFVYSGGLWNGSLAHHDATPITVHDGDVVDLGGLDSPGPATWSVTGKVTNGTDPVAGLDIYLYEADGHFLVRHVTTNDSGTFTTNVNPTVQLQAFIVDHSGLYAPVSWGSTTLGGPGTQTFSVPLTPVFGIVDLGTQVVTPATP